MNDLRYIAANYLAIRRSLGFKLGGHDRLLADFIDDIERSGAATITVQAALDWSTAPPGVSAARSYERLCAVRGFVRHLHGIDPSVEVPPADLLANRRPHRTPYLYSESDITRLMEAAGTLRPALRRATYETLFGLLGCTGMRVGEVIGLDRSDVDLGAGMVDITEAKFRKHRRLPLHDSAVEALRHYAAVRDQLFPRPQSPSFFISTRGTRLLYVCINEVFRTLIAGLGLKAPPGTDRPRIHGLRHSFAVATVRDWHHSGVEPEDKLPVLSAYLGHGDPAYTYVYLHGAPELLAVAAERLERWEDDRR